MTYRELLEQYQKNGLEEVMKEKVEADIERQEAISDYLYDRETLPEFQEELFHESLEDTKVNLKREREFVQMVNRSVRRAFIKMGAVVGGIILIILLFVQLVLPQIVSSFYYNPGKEVAKGTNQISLDMAAYTELVMPCLTRDNVSVEPLGYGNYNICIYQNVSNNGIFTNLSGKIEKGKLTLYDINLLKRPTGNAFAWFQMPSGNGSLSEMASKGNPVFGAAGYPSEATDALNRLDDNTKYIGYVTLDKMMNYTDFMKFLKSRENLYDTWCAINTGTLSERSGMLKTDNIGFQCSLFKSTSMEWDKEAYPDLFTWVEEPMGDGADMQKVTENLSEEEFMKRHFTSLLQYMAAQKQFLSMMQETPETFLSAADYVKENGLTIYGFAVVADKDTLLELDKADEVYEIYTQPLR